jgi:hypothetical protein
MRIVPGSYCEILISGHSFDVSPTFYTSQPAILAD